MNDPWAGPVAESPKITAHQVGRIIRLIENYTATEAAELIATLATRRATGECGACGQSGNGSHSRTCPTQGDRS